MSNKQQILHELKQMVKTLDQIILHLQKIQKRKSRKRTTRH